MSLKSFDKFCENMILGEPSSQKQIFDERQNIVRSRLITEALIIFAALSMLNTMIMEAGPKWCESFFAPMVFFAALCLLWWLIRCSVKGALFGVNGTTAMKYTGGVWTGIGLLYMIINILGGKSDGVLVDGVIVDGVVGEKFLIVVSCAVLMLCGVYILVMASREDKRRKKEG